MSQKGPFQAIGSSKRMTLAQIADDLHPADWFPNAHPPAPATVAGAPGRTATPCGACHLVGGQGFIGAADLAGLPRAYIVGQVHAFAAGRRQSAEAGGRPDTLEMIKAARRVSAPELIAAAGYFSGLPKSPWIRVMESASGPAARPSFYGWMDRIPGPRQSLAGRVLEVPENTLRTFIADPHSGIVAYAPVGSLARGARLVATGGGGGQPCATCHGAGLKGGANVPPLAGRSPSYLARALWDIRSGARSGPEVALMQAPARGLNPSEITAVSAYLASLPR